MFASDADAGIVQWSRNRSYPHYYCTESGLPDPCLKVHLGQVTACFHEGRMIRLLLRVDGELIADAYDQIGELLALCADYDTQPVQRRQADRLTVRLNRTSAN